MNPDRFERRPSVVDPDFINQPDIGYDERRRD
jgi:hypothetical protein